MPEVRFWLLDVAGGEGTVDLWGIGEGGERLVVRAPFTPYFYLVPSAGSGSGEVPGRVRKEVERFRLGKPVRCLLVEADDPARAAEEAMRAGLGEAYGYDLRAADLFLISTGLQPGSWAIADAEGSGELEGYPVYRVTGGLRAEAGRSIAPELRAISFNPIYLARRASPRPDRDPVVAISVHDGRRTETLTGDERSILEAFVEYLGRTDPDVVLSFQGNRVHWDYLSRRARAAGVRFSVGRGGSEPHGSVYGHVSVRGRANVDVSEFVDEVPEVKLERLEELARYLGLEVPRDAPEDFEIGDLWEGDRARVLAYSEWRARTIFELFSAISDYVFSLSSITGMPPDHVLTAATGFKVENYLMRFAELEAKELIPPRREAAHVSYQGGMVLQPEPGLHRNVAVLDFKSMYPSIIIKYNLSLETVGKDGRPAASDRPGFLPRALGRLLEERARAREEESRSPEGSRERKVLEAKQRALKRIANATYGYTGWSGARWYAPHVAAAITAKGREVISSVIAKARELGLRVIYGDTDSVFVSNDDVKVGKLLDWISGELELEVKVEKVYVNVLFTEAKKRYAGVTADGELDVVGLEAVRGDWSEVAKRAQVEVLEVLLREGSVERAVERAREWIRRTRAGEVPLKDLIIWKQLTKPPEEYEATAAHAIVARRMREEGWDVRVGDKVGFIVVKGPGKLNERARPYFEVTRDQVDWEYYAEKQVAAACGRILEILGVDESKLLAAAKGRGLDEFFG
ncbi:MAG: DNA polymerase domain-containing protein [Conexivisphaera sp.]